MKNFLFIFIFILLNSSLFSSSIEEIRNRIADINVLFLEEKMPDSIKFLSLKQSLTETEKKYKNNQIFSGKIKTLKKSFDSLFVFYKSSPKLDTLKKEFRSFNNEFNNLFGDYFFNKLKNLSGSKLLIFSTSMSCECTLEMSYKQEAEVQKIFQQNKNKLNYAVIDCFDNFDLTSKYNIGLIPVVVLLDSQNKEIKRFVREQDLYNKLIDSLQLQQR